MSNETFEEYWHRLKETELKKDPARVDTKYQCRLAWSARGEVEQKKLQAERDKVKRLIHIMKNNYAHHDDYSRDCGDEDCMGCVLEKELEGEE